jgi:hypothetical protein
LMMEPAEHGQCGDVADWLRAAESGASFSSER